MTAPLQSLGPIAFREDSFDGIIIEMDEESASERETFSSALGSAILTWRQQSKRGIWLQLTHSHASLIPICLSHGFEFHHTKGRSLTMTLWLPSGPSTLPNPPNHQVGVGAVVLNSRGEILTVVEKNGPLKGKGIYKLPTGICDPGEDCHQAAEREVLEETGLAVSFHSVLAIRQAHGFTFGNSDMFILIAMKLADESQEIQAQESEIEESRWMDLPEYVGQECWKGHEVMEKMSQVIMSYAAGDYQGMQAEKLSAGSLYLNAKDRRDLLLTCPIQNKF